MARIVDTYFEPGVQVEAWKVGFIGSGNKFVARTYLDVTTGATPEEVVDLALPALKAEGRDFPTQQTGIAPDTWIARKVEP